MPLRACMREHTHREYRTWTAWLEKQWSEPSRSDHYLMQIAREIRYVLSKKKMPGTFTMFKIPFGWTKKVKPPTEKQKVSQAKSRWLGLLGIKRKQD